MKSSSARDLVGLLCVVLGVVGIMLLRAPLYGRYRKAQTENDVYALPPPDQTYVASLGYRPTVNPVPRPLLEVHLLDRNPMLYGEHLRVRFLRKLRDEAKFDNLDSLREAIAQDAAQARDYFARHG